MKTPMNDVKGMFATIGTGVATFIAWLPVVEQLLRIGVSIAGIFAGIYAARYWHGKTKELNKGKE